MRDEVATGCHGDDHAWDVGQALRKFGLEPDDLCMCGQMTAGAALNELRNVAQKRRPSQ